MKDYFVYDSEYKTWRHKSPIKCLINPILRKIQFWTDKPLVIASECAYIENGNDKEDKPIFLKYKITKVKYYKKGKKDEISRNK